MNIEQIEYHSTFAKTPLITRCKIINNIFMIYITINDDITINYTTDGHLSYTPEKITETYNVETLLDSSSFTAWQIYTRKWLSNQIEKAFLHYTLADLTA